MLLIGEHGNYPFNDKGQHLYPRRRFFEETVKVFRDSGRVVPVFYDKHLSYNWKDAKWMYDQAVELKVPFMAGSSLPATWRSPALELDAGTDIEEAAGRRLRRAGVLRLPRLETLQCMMERRKGGETGVAAVQCLEGDAVWKAAEEKRWSRQLLDAALATGRERPRRASPRRTARTRPPS